MKARARMSAELGPVRPHHLEGAALLDFTS
jgi:hypothetical protein